MMLSSLIVRSICRMTTGTSLSSSKCISSSVKPSILGSARMSTTSSVDFNDSRMALPWLMLPRVIDTTGDGKKSYKFYSPAEKKVITNSVDEDVRLVGCSSDGWLVMHNKRSHDLFCYDPVSARRIQLPSMVSVPDKVVISNDMDIAMMCVEQTLAFCKPGRSALWTRLNLYDDASYYDLVYSSKHKLLFLESETTSESKIETWDVTDPRSSRAVWQTSYIDNDDDDDDESSVIRYLIFADKSDELFLVERHVTEEEEEEITTGFDVFVIDIDSGKRKRYVGGGGGGCPSLFVGGKNNSFALPTPPDDDGLMSSLFPPDSIYFTDEKHPSDIGIYNYQSGTISYYPCCDGAHFTKNYSCTSSVWFTPKSCTPPSPPPAVVSNPPSSKKRVTTTPLLFFPWMFLPPLTGNEKDYKLYDLGGNKVKMFNKERVKKEEVMEEESDRFVGSSHGWLAVQKTCGRVLYLSNPTSRRLIKLPSAKVRKLVLSGSLDDDDEEKQVRAMVTLDETHADKWYSLAFCVPGRRGTEWKRLPCTCVDIKYEGYEDHVYSSRHKLFFCLGYCGRIETWDLTDTASPRMEWLGDVTDMGLWDNPNCLIKSKQGLWETDYRYLVFDDHSNQLFLIVQHVRHSIDPARKHVGKSAGFDVYKIDDWEGGGGRSGRLIYMDGSLNGLSLFIGDNNAFALSAADFPELKPDSIYYTRMIHDNGIFNYQDATFSPSTPDCQFGPKEPPLWFTPALSLPQN